MGRFVGTFLFLIASCSFAQTVDLNIPDKVEAKKTDRHTQFTGTKVFMIKPEGYELDSVLGKFVRDDSTYIQSKLKATEGFEKFKNEIKQDLKHDKSKGFLYYSKEFKFSTYDALLFFEADVQRANIDLINILYGNDKIAGNVRGYFKHNDEQAKQEILAALLSTYVDNTITEDPTVNEPYTIDVTHTRFKYNCSTDKTTYYTVDGLGDARKTPTMNSFHVVSVYPPATDYESLKKTNKTYADLYKSKGVTITDYAENQILISNQNASEILFTCTYKGTSYKVYQVAINAGKRILLFCGLTTSNFTEMINEFKNVVQTIKVK